MPATGRPFSGANPTVGAGMLTSPPKKRRLCSHRFWNRRKPGLAGHSSVQAAYEKALGCPVHPSVVYRTLQRQGWRKIMPGPKHPKASEEVRESFKKVTRDRTAANSGTGRFPRPD